LHRGQYFGKVELGYADEEIDATTADPKIKELLANG
jgi:hypothetical protein